MRRVTQASRSATAVRAVYDWLMAERPWKLLLLAVTVIIGVITVFVLGKGYILGTSPYWQQPLYDAGAHLDGWLAFKLDGWHFPIFDTYRTAFPDGTSIILTDSIPLVALVLKAIGVGLLDWHYFGWFVLVSYVLNGVALLWLLRQLGVSNVLGALGAIVFAIGCTLHNIQFESFYAHFFVIFSLGFYVRLRKDLNLAVLTLFTGMVLATLMVHPYLFAMCTGVLVVTLIELWRQKQWALRGTLIWLTGFGLLTGLLVWVTGYVAREPRGFQDHLYGLAPTFALDVLAPFQRVYSSNEIGTYLGIGFWIIALTAVWLMRRQFPGVLRRHALLTLLCAGFVLFALSTTIFVNGQTLLKVPVPDALMAVFEMFRASKRFIVPVYYLVAIVGLVWAIRSRRVWAVGLVLLALVVQVADTSYFLQAQSVAARTGQRLTFDQSEMRRDLQDVSYMNVYPSYSCLYGSGVVPLSWETPLELQHIAATESKIMNSVRSSRRTQDCTAESIRAVSAPQKDSMTVYLRNAAGDLIYQPDGSCTNRVDFKFGVYCKTK